MDAKHYASFLQDLGQQDEDRKMRENTTRIYEEIRTKQYGPRKIPESMSWVYHDDATTRYMKELIYDPIVKLLPQQDQEKLRDVPIVVLPSRLVNGCVAKAPNGQQLIIIDSGLMPMVHFWFERFFEAAWLADNKPLSEVVNFNAITYKFVVDQYKHKGIFGFPLPSSEKRPTSIRDMTNLMTVGTELFVVLHEIAHIVSEDVESSLTEQFRMFPSKDGILDISNHSWRAEHLADGIAYKYYEKIWRSHEYFSMFANFSNPVLPKQVPFHFFQYLALIEKNVPALEGMPTHPPAPLRLAFLLRLIEKDGDQELIKCARYLLETISDMPRVV